MAKDLPEQLGRYRILRRIGAGGMAEVFLAKSTGAEGIEKLLVLKRVLPSFARSSKFITMFVDEAKVAMRLNHPNIVQVYAFEQSSGEFLLAMELVDGLDLGRLVSAGRRQNVKIPFGLAAYLVMEVAKGLDYAHKRKDASGVPMEIVHRDVSPQNVLLTYEGVVKVADFGIAKARMVSEETGVIKGKFAYMSPEQARGEKVDNRSDVYSLGVLFAELLMGRAMYPGRQGLDVLEAVRGAQRTLPSEVDSTIPKQLDRIVRRATSADREERYQTARSLAGALAQYLHNEEQVWDAEALEHFIDEVAPREQTSPEGLRRARAFTNGQTVHSRSGTGELRERRLVVVVAGRFREDASRTDASIDAGAEVAKVLADIAYKTDAVLSWPDGPGKGRFRFIVGLGKASVNDPLEAVRIATDTIEALAGLSADLLTPISASLGLSRGTVSTVRDASGRLLRYSPIGAVIEVAEGLADVGKQGEVLVAGEVYRLARRDYAFDAESREVDVRTEAGSAPQVLTAWALRSARTREERQAEMPVGDLPLVGRDDEVRTIRELYEDAVATKKTIFAVFTGELGVGKTSLLGAALGTLDDPEPRILRTECTFGSSDVPFAAVADLVRDAADISDEASPAEAGEALEKLLQAHLPAEASRAAYEALSPLVGVTHEGGEGDLRTVTRGLELLIAGLTRKRPVVIWIDNMQWGDTPSLELLGGMRQRGYDTPCLVLMSTRPETRLEPLMRGMPQIEIESLDDEGTRQLIEQHFDASVPDDVVQAIMTRASGNPFFVNELVDALIERGAVEVADRGDERRVLRRPGVPIQLPTTLEGVVAARLDELDETERLAIRWLSVAGRGLREGELSQLAGIELGDAVQGLVGRGLVHERSGGVLDFSSAVVRQVAYEGADIDDRIRMHRRIAQHLRDGDRPAAPGRIARHLEQAGERASAARAYLEAADAARAVYSNREALRFFGRGLQLLSPDDHEARFRAHAGREQILRFLGRPNEQAIELEAMKGIARRHGGPRRRATALLRLARYELDAARYEAVAEVLPEAAQAALASGDRALELDALRLQAELARNQGDPEAALEFCEEALDRAGNSRDLLDQRAHVLIQKGILLRRAGRAEEAFEAYTEAIVIFRRLGIRRSEAFALSSLGVALTANGLYEDAITVFRASIHIDRETGDRLRLGRKLSNVGQLYDTLGDPASGLAFVQRALDVFEAVDDRAGRCDALSAIAEMMLEKGEDPAAAAVPLDQARRIASRLGSNYEIARERLVRAQLEHARGRLPRAAEAARSTIEAARREGLVGFELHALARLAAIKSASGDEDAPSVAREVAIRLREGATVERAERLWLLVADTLGAAGDDEGASGARELAEAVVQAKAEAIRSDALRTRFLSTRDAKAARGVLGGPNA